MGGGSDTGLGSDMFPKFPRAHYIGGRRLLFIIIRGRENKKESFGCEGLSANVAANCAASPNPTVVRMD